MKIIKTFEIFGIGKKYGVPILPTGTFKVWKVPMEMTKLKIALEILKTDLLVRDFYFIYSNKPAPVPKVKGDIVYVLKDDNGVWGFIESYKRLEKEAAKENKTIEFMGEVEITQEVIDNYNMKKSANKYNI